jgi:hypothetical protein
MVALPFCPEVWAVMKAIIALAFIFAVLAGFAIWWLIPRPLPEVVVCEKLIPGVKQVGLKFSRAREGGIDIDFGGTATTNSATAETLKAFIDCLKEQNASKAINVIRGVNLDLEPIGQVADHWKTDPDLRIKLMPNGEDKILNNMRIGPAAGRKQDIIRNWCSPDQAGRCVKCVPDNPTETTTYVEVQLRPTPPVERQQMPGIWSGAPAGRPLDPWQLVEPDGRRFVFVCKP